MTIKIKKLHTDAIIPAYQTQGAAGFDLHAIEETFLRPGERKLIATGLAFAIEQGYEVQIRGRSGLAFKFGIGVLNAPGTIDSDYRGEIKVLLVNHGDDDFHVNKGDRIAQAVVAQVEMATLCVVDELDDTLRGEKGFGSTGV